MMIDVRPSVTFDSASRTMSSVSVSMLAVASSRMRMSGFIASTRAKFQKLALAVTEVALRAP